MFSIESCALFGKATLAINVSIQGALAFATM
jgi:hypothetical protein